MPEGLACTHPQAMAPAWMRRARLRLNRCWHPMYTEAMHQTGVYMNGCQASLCPVSSTPHIINAHTHTHTHTLPYYEGINTASVGTCTKPEARITPLSPTLSVHTLGSVPPFVTALSQRKFVKRHSHHCSNWFAALQGWPTRPATAASFRAQADQTSGRGHAGHLDDSRKKTL